MKAKQINKNNQITDVVGIRVGNAQNKAVQTGVTLIVPDKPALCAVDVRGGGPGTRETDAISSEGSVKSADAIVLSGGSVYGLDAASELTKILGANRIGYEVAPAPVPVSPIIPAAILFDNANGGDKAWGEDPPYARLARQAYARLATQFSLGNVGAGYGAMAGLHKGGLGSASMISDVFTLGAIMAVNSVGSPFMPGTDCFWAWDCELKRDEGGEYGARTPPPDYRPIEAQDTKLAFLKSMGASTIIGVVATDADLTHSELRRLAIMAQDGIAMAVRPAHTPMDGDTIFAITTGKVPLQGNRALALSELGAAAAQTVARAIARGVYCAQSYSDNSV